MGGYLGKVPSEPGGPTLPFERALATAGWGSPRREPGQLRFQILRVAPVAPEAMRIKAAEWAETEAKVIDLFDFEWLLAGHLPTRKVGARVVEIRAEQYVA